MTKIIHLNVGGTRYDIAEETLLNHEDTMLAKLVSSKWKKGGNQEPLFIDRNGERFQYIVDWYRDGQITVPRTISVNALRNDALFFGLPENVVIEETKSFDDYASCLHVVRTALSVMSQKNDMERLAISAILELLSKMSSSIVMPGKVYFSSDEYKKTHPLFSLKFSQKDALIAAVHKIFNSLGDELLPAFLTSVDLTCYGRKASQNDHWTECLTHVKLEFTLKQADFGLQTSYDVLTTFEG
jgi:hypothetical protein